MDLNKIDWNPDVDLEEVCCPYCGGEEFYEKVRYSGTGNYYLRFDGQDAENGLMTDSITRKRTSKRIFCGTCDKALGTFKDEKGN